MNSKNVEKQIVFGSEKAGKTYEFEQNHDPTKLAQMWFQQSEEGLILFTVFYTQACRWSRCLGCNLPSKVSQEPVSYKALIAQIDNLFADPEVASRRERIQKAIISNNGSVLDEATFSSTALMYLIAKMNLNLPNMSVLSMESRPEYVDSAELEFISRALAEGDTPRQRWKSPSGSRLSTTISETTVFDKGLTLETFEKLVEKMAPHEFRLKCYFMQKPVPDMSDEQAVEDIWKAVDYLSRIQDEYGIHINMHLNPTYAASGTALETAFKKGRFTPPRLVDVAKAAFYAKNKGLSIFIGLSDEGLAVDGGSFIVPGSEEMVACLEKFNRSQDFSILEGIIKH